jgi:hypothetical protein
MVRTPENEPLTKREFENYIKNIYDNPLSLSGEKLVKFERFMDDVQYLAAHLREQQSFETTNEQMKFPKENQIH